MYLRRLLVILAEAYLLLMLPARNLAQETAREPRLVIAAFDADTAQRSRNRSRRHATRLIESRSYRTDQTRSSLGRQAPIRKARPLPQELSRTIVLIALQEGVDHMFILEMMRQESGFCRTARSGKNAHGLMQFIPSTARRFGVHNPNDPVEAITGACRYIKYLASLSYIHNDPSLVLAGYNAGEGAVRLAGGHVPAISETRQYVGSIMAGYRRARELQSQISGRQAALQPVKTSPLGSWTARPVSKESLSAFTRIPPMGIDASPATQGSDSLTDTPATNRRQ